MKFTVLNISCSFTISILLALHLQAQPLHFDHYTSEQGLSQSNVNCMLQDQRGFLWVGTNNGLNRFDGERFIHYKNQQGDATSVSNNTINAILEDSEGAIWVGTMNGLNRFDPETETFQQYLHVPEDPKSIAYNQVHSLCEDVEGNLWIGASLSLDKLDKSSGTFTHFRVIHDLPIIPGNLFIKQITSFENDLLIGTWGEGVYRFNRSTEEATRIFTDTEKLNGNSWVEQIWIDPGGSLWVGSSGYVLQYDEKLNLLRLRFGIDSMDFTKTITTFLKTESGYFVAGTSGSGIYFFNPEFEKKAAYLPDPDSTYQYNNFISTLLRTQDGEIWLGTLGNGIFKFDPERKKFWTYRREGGMQPGAQVNDMLDVIETASGDIWTASRSNGIQIFEREKRRFTSIDQQKEMPDGLKVKQVSCLFQDSRKRIWVGTWGDGLEMYDPETGQLLHFKSKKGELDDNFVASVCESNDYKLWVTMAGGISVIDLSYLENGILERAFPQHSLKDKLSHRYATTALCNQNGVVWIGTAEGLNRYLPESESFQHFFHDPFDPTTLAGPRVNCIFEDRKNRLWIGTSGGGLNLYLPEEQYFVHYTEADGLPNDIVQGIVEDKSGYLWLTTEGGLSKFDPDTKSFSNFFRQDGLPGNRFSRGAIGITRGSGEIFAGGVDGFVLFHPDSIRKNSFIPPVAIASLKKYVSNGSTDQFEWVKGISALDRIELPYSENTLTFEFAALNFRQAFKNQYAYKFNGLFNDWTYLGNRREVTFSNLQPGTYTLRVKASNNDGVWNEKETTLTVVIRPPWYRSWWAYLLYVLAAVGLIFFFLKKELQAERLKYNLELEKIAADKLKEVDQLKSQLYTNITHEFRTPLTVISGMADTIEKPEKSKRLILRNSQRLLTLVNQMLDLAKLESGKLKPEYIQADVVPFLHYICESFQSYASGKNIRLLFSKETDYLVMDFDEDKLQSILSNLLSNAVKFTDNGGEVGVSVKEEQEEGQHNLIVQVEDNGTGISADRLPHIFDRFYQVDGSSTRKGEGTGIGLTLTKELVELMGGTIDASSKKGSGSLFTLRLPVRNVAPFGQIEKLYPEKSFLSVDILTEESSAVNGQVSPDKPLLLVIEDNADVVTYIRSVVEDTYQVLISENGADGIEKALETIPDIIICDLMMPEKDGYEVTQTLKLDERTSHVPIIILTAKADVHSRIEGLERGADAYLAKPFDKKELMVSMQKLIELRSKLQARYAGRESSLQVVEKPMESQPRELEDSFLLKMGRIMDANLEDSEFTVTTLCQECGLSQPQLYRKLKALTGKSIVAYMRSYRLQRAKNMLLDPNLNVSEIAYKVGFSDPAYFSRAFSEEFGEPPLSFRK